MDCFDKSRVYLDRSTCQSIQKFIEEHREVWHNMRPHIAGQGQPKEDTWGLAFLKVTKQIPPIRQQIERQFRGLLRIDGEENGEETSETG